MKLVRNSKKSLLNWCEFIYKLQIDIQKTQKSLGKVYSIIKNSLEKVAPSGKKSLGKVYISIEKSLGKVYNIVGSESDNYV